MNSLDLLAEFWQDVVMFVYSFGFLLCPFVPLIDHGPSKMIYSFLIVEKTN